MKKQLSWMIGLLLILSSCHDSNSGKSRSNSSNGGPTGDSSIVEDPTPSLSFTETARGCQDLFIHQFNANWTEVLVVSAARSTLGLSTTPKTFDLTIIANEDDTTEPEDPNPGLSVFVETYTRSSLEASDFPYCRDTADSHETPVRWTPRAGNITLTLSKEVTSRLEEYRVSATLQGVVFVDPTGEKEVTLEQLELLNVAVGGFQR